MTERRPDPPDPVPEPRDEPAHEGPRGPRPYADDDPDPLADLEAMTHVAGTLNRMGFRIVAVDVGRGLEAVPIPSLDDPRRCTRCGTPKAPGCRYCAPALAWCN